MHLVGEYLPNAIKVNQNAKREHESLLSTLFFLLPNSDTMTIKLLNERSLRKQYDDALRDVDLFNNDVLSLTETELYLEEDKSKIITKFRKKQKKQRLFLTFFSVSTNSEKNIKTFVQILVGIIKENTCNFSEKNIKPFLSWNIYKFSFFFNRNVWLLLNNEFSSSISYGIFHIRTSIIK